LSRIGTHAIDAEQHIWSRVEFLPLDDDAGADMVQIPQRHQWLYANALAPVPRMIAEVMKLFGTKEMQGSSNTQAIQMTVPTHGFYRKASACLFALPLFVFFAQAAQAQISTAMVADNISAEFDYWPQKSNQAWEYGIPGGHKYRVWKGQVVQTFGSQFTIGGEQVAAKPGGVQVIFRMDHVINLADDANAAISLFFDGGGELVGASITLSPSKGAPWKFLTGVTSIAVTAVSGDKSGASAAADAANKLAEKFEASVVNAHGGTELMPSQIVAMSQRIIEAVSSAAHGQRIRYQGNAIQAWEGNNCRQNLVGSVTGDRRSMNLTQRGQPFPNDEMRSIRLFNTIQPGTLIQVFDDSGGSHTKDDWAEIVIDNPALFSGVGECVKTFERNRNDYGLRVYKYGRGNLDGKVSRFSIFPPGQWPPYPKGRTVKQ
jgi:hypothetical protein